MSVREPGRRRRAAPPPATRSCATAGSAARTRQDLAARFGTPFYAYDLDVVTRQVEALRAVLPPSFDLAYAVKANPMLAVLRAPGRPGPGRGRRVRRRAAPRPARRVRGGPGRHDGPRQARRGAARRGRGAAIRAVTVESPGELARLAAIARGARAAPAGAAAGRRVGGRRASSGSASWATTGRASSGWTAADLRAAARARRRLVALLEPLGLHAFGASNVLDAAALAGARRGDRWRRRVELAREAGFPLRLVDAGGGLGIPYEPDEAARPGGARARGWRPSRPPGPATGPAPRARILLEPGRFLVGASGRVRRAGRGPQVRQRARRRHP